MKARYGILLAVMLTVIFAGAVFADTASADDYTVTVTVQPDHIHAEKSEYTTYGGEVAVKLICDEGYYFVAGTTVTYKLGDNAPVDKPVVLDQDNIEIDLSGITDDASLVISSATVSNIYKVTVDTSGLNCYCVEGTEIPVTYGDDQAVTIKPSNGYRFTVGSNVVYNSGSATGLSYTIGDADVNGFTLNVEDVTGNITLKITSVPAQQIEYSVTLSKAISVMCEVPTIDPATPSPIHYGDNVTVRITAIAGYSFTGTTANVRVTGSSTTESDYDLTVTGNYATFVIPNITENIAVRVLEVEMEIATYTFTVVDNSGNGITSEEVSYSAKHGDEVRIGLCAAHNYYLLKNTQIVMTQYESDDLVCNVETDCRTVTLITKPITGNITITINSVSIAPVKYYATSNDDGYGSFYLTSIGDLTTPTDVGRGTLYLTEEATGWFRMSAPVQVEEEGTPKIKYFATRLIQHDGITADYDTSIEFSTKSSLVHVSSGVIDEIRAEINASVSFVKEYLDTVNVVFDGYINDSSSVMTFTGSNTTSWTYNIPTTAYKAFVKDVRTGYSLLHFMKDVPTVFSAKNNKDGYSLYLCPSSDSASTTITVTGYAAIYQDCTPTSISDKVIKFTGSPENGDTFTLVEKDGLFQSVTVDAGKSFMSNGTTYVNSGTSSATFTISGGDVITGYVISILDASNGVTTYYSTMDVILGSTSIIDDGDIAILTQNTTELSGITLSAGLTIRSYGASNAVTVVYGNAVFKISGGVITWIIVPEDATLIDGSGKIVGVVKKGASNVEIQMDSAGENISAVKIGSDSEVYTTLNYNDPAILIDGITLCNMLRDYSTSPVGIAVNVYKTEGDIVIRPATGSYVVLERGTTWTVYNADDAIANAVSGDNIQIFGDASTSGSRDYYMTMTSFADSDWDKFLRLLGEGVSVNGEIITGSGARYVHIMDGELYVVKNYGYRHSYERNNSRWIWYDYNKLLYYGGSSPTANFRITSNTFNTESPGEPRTFVYRGDTDALNWMRANVSPTVETIETHNGQFDNYIKDLQASHLKKVMMYSTSTLAHYRFSETTIEYLYSEAYACESSVARYCHNLKEVVLPNMKEISYDCFRDDENLTYLTCPKIEYVGSNSFRDCVSLKSVDGYDVSSTPTKTTIEGTAFYNCTSLEYVNLPMVKTIKDTAFARCYTLRCVNLPSVETIGIEAFYMCHDLTELNIPNVKSIGRYGFFECYSLGDLYLPEVQTIGAAAFSGSSTGSGESKVFSTYGIAARTVYAPKATDMGEYAFANCPNLETVICPSLYRIYAYAFFNAVSLKTFDAPNLERTNDKDGYWNDLGYVFYNCTSLTSVNVPKAKTFGVLFFGKCGNLRDVNADGVEDILDNAFKGCVSLENLYLPTVTYIGTRAFVGATPGSGLSAYGVDACTSLKSVYMPNVVTIKNCAFLGCDKLESVVMDSVDEILEYAFYKCTSLKSVYAPILSKDLGQYSFTFDTSLESLDMRGTDKSIGQYSFYNCTALKYVNIDKVAHVYTHAFDECKSLETLYISACKDVFEYGFNNCIKLKHLTAPKMETVGSYAFMNDAALLDADLASAQSIGYCAFLNCEKLSTLNMPAVRMLNEYCFKNTGITQLDFGNDGTAYTMDTAIVVLRNAFEHCISLTDVVIGTSEKVYIDTYYQNAVRQEVFKDCTALKNVTIGKITRLSTNMFQNCDKLEKCVVKEAGTINSYAFQAVGPMELTVGSVTGDIGEKIIITSNTKKITIGDVAGYIESNAFGSTTKLKTVILGNTGEIRYQAFANNTDLTTFRAGNVSSMANRIFAESTKLEEVQIASTGSIGSEVFYNCQALVYVNVEVSDENRGVVDLTNIPLSPTSTSCFYNCKNMTKVQLSDATTVLPSSVFSCCSSMIELKGKNVVRVDQYALTQCTSLQLIDVNRSTANHVTVCMYDNYAIWHTTHTVYIGGYQVTSPNGSGKNKTLTLENCTVNPYHTNGYSRNDINASQTSTSVFDRGFKYIVINDDVTIIREAYYGSSVLTNLDINGENISIGNHVFANGRLEQIRITADIELNSTEIFRSDSYLTTIYGGEHILSIGTGVFRYDYALLNVYDDSYNPEGSGDNRIISMPNLVTLGNDGLNLVISYSQGTDYPYRVNHTDYGGKIAEFYAPNLTSIGIAGVMSNALTKVTLGDVTEMYTMSFGRMNDRGNLYYGCPNLHSFTCRTYTDTIGTAASVKELSTDMFVPSGVAISVIAYINHMGITGAQEITDKFKGDTNLQTLILGNVTVSADEIFANTPNLRSVKFVGNAALGEGAFKDCSNLASITMVNCSPNFGKYTFENCTSLKSFNADDDCHPTVSTDMFLGCSALESFNVKGLTKLPDRLFAGCSSLKKINSTTNGYAVLNQVTEIGDSPFSGIVITHMELDGMKTVNSVMFSGLSAVEYLSLNGVTTIDDNSFSDLDNLQELYIDSMAAVSKKKVNNEFNDNDKLRIVSIKGARTIQMTTFMGCKALETVYLCDDPITSQTLAGTITISEYAFSGCTSLSSINLDWALSVESGAFRDSGVVTVSLPLATGIGDHAFYNCANMTHVSIGSCVEYGSYCFSCDYDPVSKPLGTKSGLTEIIIEASGALIGEYMFSNCDKLVKIYSTGTCAEGEAHLDTVGSIDDGAFKGCKGLTVVYLPSTLSRIGDYSFDGCSNLVTVNTAEGVDLTIGNYSFRGCTALSDLKFGSVVEIGNNTFEGCNNLGSLVMNKLKTMGTNSFSGCYGLTTVTMNSLEKVTSGAFSGCNSLIKVNMKKVNVIGSNAFSNCSSLTTFGGDQKILTLTNVTTVGDYAFSGCTSFESIKFGVYLTSIGAYAFYDVFYGPLKPLTQLIFPNSLTYIGEGAFSSQYGSCIFDTISIPSSVTNIGTNAFSSRANTLSIYFNGNIDQNATTSTKLANKTFKAAGTVTVYMWNECTGMDIAKYVETSKTITVKGEHHAQVWMYSNDGVICSYRDAVLLNDGYIILPYGEESMTSIGKNPVTLYYGMIDGSSVTAESKKLALLNEKGVEDSIAKSGDYFRPVVTYTMSDELKLYYLGCKSSIDVGGGVDIDANFESGITKEDVPGWTFDHKIYWYRDEVIFPTFGGTIYKTDTIYGKDSKINLSGDHAVYYPNDTGAVSITLGYIESMLLVTVQKFETTVYWVDAQTPPIETTAYFGDTVDVMPEARNKTAYHFLWWSTVEGSYEEKDKVVPGVTTINTVETFYYAIYAPNTYYVKIYCSSPIDISGYVVDPNTGYEYFTMSGAFSFYMDGDKGEVYYKDKDHTTYTLMFAAATWQEGYRFSDFVYKGIQVEGISAKEEYNPELGDGIVYTIEMSMIERTYSLHLQFLDANDNQPLDNEYVVIGNFVGKKQSYSVDTTDMTVKNILYSDLKNNVMVPVPLYDNNVERYTYNNVAKNVTYGNTNIQKDDDQNLYINYESFRVTGGAKTDDITIAYYFDEGMYNIKYIYDDDAKTIYNNPATVQEGTKVSIANAEGKVRTGYLFDKWVVLNSEGEIPVESERIYYYPGDKMLIDSTITVNADNTNTISLKGLWTPKTVTITFDLGAYPGTEPSITQKVNDTFALPDGSNYNMSGWVMTGWYFVKGGDVYTTLTLTPTIYGAYIQDGEILPMHANWVVKTYSFAVKHYDEKDPETQDCPSASRYTNVLSYAYNKSPIELWKADVIDSSQQFKTLKGWQVKYTYKEGEEKIVMSVDIPLGVYEISESTWQKLADIAKKQGSDTLECYQLFNNKEFNLFFDTAGGGALPYNTLGPLKINEWFNVYSGDSLEKRGYTFSGWYCGTDTITVYSPSLDPKIKLYQLTTTMASMAVEDTITFTAIWAQSSYEIKYDLDGGVPSGVIPRTAYYETQVEIDYPTRSGYDFKGWTATGTLSGAQYKNGDRWSAWDGESIVLSKSFCYLTYEDGSTVTLTANWEQTTYNISWNNLNGGSGTPSGGTASAAIGDKFTLATLIGAEKIGYTFMGWSYDKVNIYTNASGKFNEELAAAADSNNTVQMYALWNPITYELWYNYNGNTQQQYVKITVRYDEEINVEHLDRTGYSFDGWTSTDASATTSKYSTDGDEWNSWYDPSTVVNASYFKNLSSTQDAIVHMVATYTPVTYHVLYDANGGTGAAPTDTAAYNVGDKFTLASYETLIGTNGEKSIIGWSMDRNANAGSTITVFNENVALAADSSNTVTFYAIWVSNGCLIKVDLGDAIASYTPSGWKQQQETKYYVKQVEYGSPVKEAMADWDNVTISKEGYVFTSWNYSATTAITDVLVTCNFEKIHVPKYCLMVDLGDATSSAIPMGWEQGSGNVFFKEFMTAVPVEEALTDWDNIIISRGGHIFSSWGEPTVLTVQEIIVTCNFAKVTVNDDSSVRFEVEDGSSMSLTNYSVSELKERASTRDVTLTVDCSGSTIVFDRGSILALNGGGKLSVNEVDRTMLPESIRQQIKDAPIYEIEFGSNTYFGEGNVTVTLPYALKSTEDPDDIRIYYLKDGIVAEKLDCTYDNGKVTFTTNHFSVYAVVNEPAENSSSTDNSLIIAIIGGIVGTVIGSLAVIAAVVIAKKRKA